VFPPGRSVRPRSPLWKIVSPENRTSSYRMQNESWVWPGVWIGFSSWGKSCVFLLVIVFAFSKRSMFPMWSQWSWVMIRMFMSSGFKPRSSRSSNSSSSFSFEEVSIRMFWLFILVR